MHHQWGCFGLWCNRFSQMKTPKQWMYFYIFSTPEACLPVYSSSTFIFKKRTLVFVEMTRGVNIVSVTNFKIVDGSQGILRYVTSSFLLSKARFSMLWRISSQTSFYIEFTENFTPPPELRLALNTIALGLFWWVGQSTST